MRISDWSSDGCSSDLVPRMLANIRRADPLMDGHRLGRCKAPILLIRAGTETEGQGSKPVFDWQRHTASEVRSITIDCSHAAMLDRSEERRSGKECVSSCKSWWSPEPLKKKEKQ